jgi:hypothetical protein
LDIHSKLFLELPICSTISRAAGLFAGAAIWIDLKPHSRVPEREIPLISLILREFLRLSKLSQKNVMLLAYIGLRIWISDRKDDLQISLFKVFPDADIVSV